MFTEEEEMMRDAVSRFAQDVIAPRVRSMDENQKMDTAVIDGMHANGLLGVEIDEEFGGGGFGFTAALIVVEELAKVDASVSVLCDIQNTLINNTSNSMTHFDFNANTSMFKEHTSGSQ